MKPYTARTGKRTNQSLIICRLSHHPQVNSGQQIPGSGVQSNIYDAVDLNQLKVSNIQTDKNIQKHIQSHITMKDIQPSKQREKSLSNGQTIHSFRKMTNAHIQKQSLLGKTISQSIVFPKYMIDGHLWSHSQHINYIVAPVFQGRNIQSRRTINP